MERCRGKLRRRAVDFHIRPTGRKDGVAAVRKPPCHSAPTRYTPCADHFDDSPVADQLMIFSRPQDETDTASALPGQERLIEGRNREPSVFPAKTAADRKPSIRRFPFFVGGFCMAMKKPISTKKKEHDPRESEEYQALLDKLKMLARASRKQYEETRKEEQRTWKKSKAK